jgi:hypothetical protein
VCDAAFRHGSARVQKCCNRKHGRNNHQPCQGEDLDADGMEPRRSGAMRPAWNASCREGDRGETHSVSMIRSGPARFWPVVPDGRHFHCTSPRGYSHVSINVTRPGYP